MILEPGKRLGVYEITARIGEGGMGQVYQARDAQLGRDVAIKILPPAFATDPDRIARFQREARALASLNHPNIAQIYGLEQTDGAHALVMELVSGDDLSERLTRGAMRLDEALPIARQIAEALEAAHQQGIIHRDLKPANIKVRPDGTVKVLDFGLAKTLVLDEAAPTGGSHTPTITALAMTEPGMILGTVAYMSPDQARGRAVDKRTDIWAFGCVLFEMLAGTRVFPGATAADVTAAIIGAEPDWSRIPADATRRVGRLLRRCLEKDPKRRLHDIADARIEIEDESFAAESTTPTVESSSRFRASWTWIVAIAVVAAAVGAVSDWALRSPEAPPETWVQILPPPIRQVGLAVSPNGRQLVVAAGSALWLRSLDSAEERMLTGTEGASSPFWSPDSRSIGFFADAKLKLIDLDGGSLRTLSSVTDAHGGGTWNDDGTIIFAPAPGVPLLRIPDGGGEAEAVTRFASPQHRSHGAPLFLPDGRHFLFFVIGQPESRGVYLGTLGSADSRRLFDADTPAAYASGGYVLFGRDGRLWAQRFDADALTVRGDPFSVAEGITPFTVISASGAGPIAYRTPPPDSGERWLVWTDRSGLEIERVAYPGGGGLGPALSKDGGQVAVFKFTGGNMDIWRYEIARRTWSRETFHAADEIYPVWSPDGHSIAFGSNRDVKQASINQNLFVKRIGTSPGSEELLLATPAAKFLMDWSTDGRFLLFDSIHPTRGTDIWTLPLEGRTPVATVQTDFNERFAQFSPDGNWIAYQSDKTGRFEVYLQPFPGPGNEVAVSTDGGLQVRWNPDGKELFYVAPDNGLMAVPIRVSADGKKVEPASPSRLFVTNVATRAPIANRHQYVVSPDGQTFIMNVVPNATGDSPITIILNWKPSPR